MKRLLILALLALPLTGRTATPLGTASNPPVVQTAAATFTIQTGVTTTFNSGSITTFASGSTVNLTGATVNGLTLSGYQSLTGTLALGGFGSITGRIGSANLPLSVEIVYLPEAYGAVGDAIQINDGAMSTGSAVLTSASNLFIAGMVGKKVAVPGAGAAGVVLTGTVSAFTSAGSITLSASNASGGNVTGAYAVIGTDDAAAFNSMIAAMSSTIGGTIVLSKCYGIGSVVTINKSNITMRGIGISYAERQSPDNQTAWGSSIVPLAKNISVIRVRPTTGRLTNIKFSHFAYTGLGPTDGNTGFDISKADDSQFSANACFFDTVSIAQTATGIRGVGCDAFSFSHGAVDECTTGIYLYNGVFAKISDNFIADNYGVGIQLDNEYCPAVTGGNQIIRNGGGGVKLRGTTGANINDNIFETDATDAALFTVPNGIEIGVSPVSTSITTTTSDLNNVTGNTFKSIAASGTGSWANEAMRISGGSTNTSVTGNTFGLAPIALRITSGSAGLISGNTFAAGSTTHIQIDAGTTNKIGVNGIDPAKVTVAAGTTGSAWMPNLSIAPGGSAQFDTRLDVGDSSTSTTFGADFQQIPFIVRNTSNTLNNWRGVFYYADNTLGIAGIGAQLINNTGSNRYGAIAWGTRNDDGFQERGRMLKGLSVGSTTDPGAGYIDAVNGFKVNGTNLSAIYQPLDSDLTSWAAITRASGFDTFVATPSGANLATLLTTALPASKGGTGLTALGTGVTDFLDGPGNNVIAALNVDIGSAGAVVLFNGALGTPSSGTLTNATGLPITGITSSTSAQLRTLLSDENGTGAALFDGATSPTFVTPALGTPSALVGTNITGTATAFNINGTVGATTPAAGTFTTGVFGSTTSLLLGTAGSAVGNIGFRNATSGTATLAPPTGALGTYTVTLPNAASTIPIASQQITWSGPTAARTYTLPDAAATLARTDAANTFTGASTATSWVFTTPILGTPTSGALTNCTSIPAGQLTGSIADARLSANVPLLNAANTFTANNTLANNNNGSSQFKISNTNAGSSANSVLWIESDQSASLIQFGSYSSTHGAYGIFGASQPFVYFSNATGAPIMNDAGPIIFAANGNTETGRIGANGFKGGWTGTTTNDNAAAGNVGQYVSASVVQGSATALTTATPKTVTSISLTAGDWDITGIGALTGASTGTVFDVAIGTTTNSFTGTVLGDTRAETPTVSLTGADATLMIPSVRVSISATTTYYLIVSETFTIGSPAAYGRISARRVR